MFIWHELHYQLQFNENAIKSLLKTDEPIFHGHENGDSPFHGLCQAHENSIKYYMT